MIKTLAGLAVLTAGWTLSAWLLMLAIRAIHDDWLPVVPPISYGPALVLTVLLGARMLIGTLVTQFFKDLLDDDKPARQ